MLLVRNQKEPDTSQNVAEYGTAEVTDEELELYTAEVLDLLKLLLKRRDMTINEVKLILAIEDPRAQEARRVYGIEVSLPTHTYTHT